VILKIVPKAGFDLFTGENQPMIEKEIQSKISVSDFGTMFRISMCLFSKDQAESVYLFFSLLSQLSILITISAFTERFIKFTGLQEKIGYRYSSRDPVHLTTRYRYPWFKKKIQPEIGSVSPKLCTIISGIL
jgi:hypothetical protein